MKVSEVANTQSNIQLNTLYKPNPKGGRAIRGNHTSITGSDFLKEWDFR
jgi:hypothetical protein